VRSRLVERTKSLTEPTISVVSHASHVHIGRGVPQHRFRLSAQSTLFSSQVSNLPVLRCSGIQLIDSLFGEEPIFTSTCSHIPGRLRILEERRIAPPTERVGMTDSLGGKQIPVLGPGTESRVDPRP
jgi:hypothetical protein